MLNALAYYITMGQHLFVYIWTYGLHAAGRADLLQGKVE